MSSTFHFACMLALILSPCSHGKAEREPDTHKWQISLMYMMCMC